MVIIQFLSHMNWCVYAVWILAVLMGALHEIYNADTIFVFKKYPAVQRLCRFALLLAIVLCLGARFDFMRSDSAMQIRFIVDPFIACGVAISLFLVALFAVRAVLWAWFGEWPRSSKSESDTTDEPS